MFALVLVMAWLGGATASAEPLWAVVAGGLISGDWAGTPFTNASYTVAAPYDPAGTAVVGLAIVAFAGWRRFGRA